MEVALNSSTVHDFDRKRGDVPQMIDIVVSDLSEFEDPDSDPRIAHHVHEAFIEAKHFRKGWWPVSAARALDSVQRDVDRLAEHINRGHCRVAAVLILDDERFFTDRGSGIKWPHSVERYLLNESRARRA